jgi:periplasmic protein TonB
MFETTLSSSWDERSRRGMTALTSFGLQALAVAVLLVIPLLRPAGLPFIHQLSMPVSLGRPLGSAPVVVRRSGASAPTSDPAIVLRPSTSFPVGKPSPDEDGPPQVGPSGPYAPGPSGPGSDVGLLNSLATATGPLMPAAPAVRIAPIRISHMSEGDVIRKVLPTYPPLARGARIQGQVILQAVISKQGTIENLRLVTGHPMLVPAAIEAVRQWRYRPYILNNDPVEVETQITVNFSLAGN